MLMQRQFPLRLFSLPSPAKMSSSRGLPAEACLICTQLLSSLTVLPENFKFSPYFKIPGHARLTTNVARQISMSTAQETPWPFEDTRHLSEPRKIIEEFVYVHRFASQKKFQSMKVSYLLQLRPPLCCSVPPNTPGSVFPHRL